MLTSGLGSGEKLKIKGGGYVSERLKQATFWVGLLGAVKLATDAFGFNIISDEQVNTIANGLAAICTVGGILLGVVFGKEQKE